MYAFRIDRETHFSLARQNASLCGIEARHGIELTYRQGRICPQCDRIEHAAWVSEWQRQYAVLGPIKPPGLKS